MDTGKSKRARGPAVVLAALGIWVVGAYLPAVSSTWVLLNLVTPAGRPSIATFPYAYPAIGIDGHTLVSLIGLLLVIAGTVHWTTLVTKTIAAAEAPDGSTIASSANPAPPASRPGAT